MNRPGTKAILSIAIVVMLIAAAAYLIGSTSSSQCASSASGVSAATPQITTTQSVPSNFTLNGRTFNITYVATNNTEWQSGLMDKKVTNSTFMLFVFPSLAVYPFWMYHVNSSLDIIWLHVAGDSGCVVYLAADVPGCTGLSIVCPNYTPSSTANYVIEAKGGFAASNGVRVGTTVQFG